MPRPISGETHTYRVNVKQRSGVYYVYERTERYENGRMRKVGNVSSQIKSRRWNTEVLERDHMFLSMLGVTAFD